MTRRTAVALVIDANVAQACSERSLVSDNHQIAASIGALIAVRHHPALLVAFSPPLRDEWNRHKSGWSHKWLYAMTSERRVRDCDPPIRDHLRRRVASLEEMAKQEAEKDVHLIELALHADRRVLSHEKACRRIFCELVGRVAKLGGVMWAGPTEDGCIDWLQAGAPLTDHYKLRRTPDRRSGRGPR